MDAVCDDVCAGVTCDPASTVCQINACDGGTCSLTDAANTVDCTAECGSGETGTCDGSGGCGAYPALEFQSVSSLQIAAFDTLVPFKKGSSACV